MNDTPLPRYYCARHLAKRAQVTLNEMWPERVNPFLVNSKLDIKASNGIAHGISFVLRPVNL